MSEATFEQGRDFDALLAVRVLDYTVEAHDFEWGRHYYWRMGSRYHTSRPPNLSNSLLEAWRLTEKLPGFKLRANGEGKYRRWACSSDLHPEVEADTEAMAIALQAAYAYRLQPTKMTWSEIAEAVAVPRRDSEEACASCGTAKHAMATGA